MGRQPRPTIKRVLAYGRVSTERQGDRGSSLKSQREEFIAYCKREGLPSPELRFEVEGAGEANEERRLELHRILGEAQSGDLVVVHKLDRWSRHAAFVLRTLEELESRGIEFRSITEPGDIRDSKLSITIRAGVAEDERIRIRARTMLGRRTLRLDGNFVEGKAPIGYRNKSRSLVIDANKAEVVRWMFARAIAGDSLRKIAVEMATRWGVVMEPSSIAYALKNRHYLGEMQTAAGREEVAGFSTGARFGSGEWVRKHKPIIERHTFELAGRAIEKRRTRGGRPPSCLLTQAWLCRSFARCGACGASIEAKPYKPAPAPTVGGQPRRTSHDGWYGCRRRLAPNVRETRCLAGPIVRRTIVDDAVATAAETRLDDLQTIYMAQPPKAATIPAIDFAGRRAKIGARREKLVDAFTDGAMKKSDLKRKLEALDAEERAVDTDEYEHQKARAEVANDTPASRRKALARVKDFRRLWSAHAGEEHAEERRTVLSVLAESIVIMGDGSTRITWREPGPLLAALVSA